jgi:hypothetical protein
MRVHHVCVREFRCIKHLEWRPKAGLNVLIGSGDSGKTTVLDAISLALAHRWNLAFCDSDFYGGIPAAPIEIEVTLTDLDAASMAKDIFGECLRGIDPDGELHDEPIDDFAAAVTVRLTVDASLEPEWALVRGPTYEPRRISAVQRQHFLAHRIDEHGTDHLTWSRTSALSRGTASSPDLPGVLADSQRAARQAVFDNPVESLTEAATAAAAFASTSAASALTNPRPGLDPALHLRSGSLVLHDGALPVSSRGLGSRRLTSLAIQQWATYGSGVLLVDEIEAGLEPHRVRHLIRSLRSDNQGTTRQVFCTTHSPAAIEEVFVPELCVVRRNNEELTVVGIGVGEAEAEADWQALARSSPEAFLGRTIVVTEGKTEVGVLRALTEHHDAVAGVDPAALRGVVVVDGGGASSAPPRAACFARLGYDVTLIVDNDGSPTTGELAIAEAAGCSIVRVSEGQNIESEIAADLPAAALQELIDHAAALIESEDPSQSIRAMVQARLPAGRPQLDGIVVADWLQTQDESEVRDAIGRAASDKKWFKSVSRGEQLGRLLTAYVDQLQGTNIGTWIASVRQVTHSDGVG